MKKASLLSVIAILLFSCTNDVQIDFTSIDGKWEMVSAKRNGNPTNTLDKSFFQFENGMFTHNINGDTVKSTYSIDKNNLMIIDPILKEIEVKKLKNDTINLSTKISKFKFEFLMKKIDDK